MASLIATIAFACLIPLGARDLDVTVHYGQLRCIGGFFAGVILYELYSLAPEWRLGAWLAPGILAGLFLFVHSNTSGPSDIWVIPISCALIAALAQSPDAWLSRVLKTPLLAWLGKISYSVYMVHYLAIVIAFDRIPRAWRDLLRISRPAANAPAADIAAHYAYAAVVIGGILLAATMTQRFIEDPSRKATRELARKWFRPGASSSKQAA